MNRLIPTFLLLGYVLLVPFCFFSGMFIVNAGAMNMHGNPTQQMGDCGMLLGGCAHSTGAGAIDSVVHHVGMYNSITQTPLTALSTIMSVAAAFLLLAFVISCNSLSIFFSRNSLRPITRRSERPRNDTELSTLRWLSLFETSPNFA